jgi:hypothetical protein
LKKQILESQAENKRLIAAEKKATSDNEHSDFNIEQARADKNVALS